MTYDPKARVTLAQVEEAMDTHLDDASGLTQALSALSEVEEAYPGARADQERAASAPRPPMPWQVRVTRPYVDQEDVWPRSTFTITGSVLVVLHDDGTSHAYNRDRWMEAATEAAEEGGQA